VSARCLATVCAALGLFGCGLDTNLDRWQIKITSPLVDERVAFCPAILDENPGLYDGTFQAPQNVGAYPSNRDEDVFIFTSAFSTLGTGVVSPTLVQLMTTPMQFDIGPIGTVYESTDLLTVPYVGTRTRVVTDEAALQITRTLVGGSRVSDSVVELKYEYAPNCEELVVVEPTSGEERSCACETTTLEFEFRGEDA
jgi:hypothetical protein